MVAVKVIYIIHIADFVQILPYQSSSSLSRLLFLFFLISIQIRAMIKASTKKTGIPIARPRISEKLSVKNIRSGFTDNHVTNNPFIINQFYLHILTLRDIFLN